MPSRAAAHQDGAIVQIGFVVPDIEAAIDSWAKCMGVGPWYLLADVKGEAPVYRGKPAQGSYTMAASYIGDMRIELVQMNDGHPSPFREWVDKRGYGLHHLTVETEDAEAEVRKYEARGYETVFSCGRPFDQQRICFMSAGFDKPAMIEIAPASEMTKHFEEVARSAAKAWDGQDPVRIFRA